MNVQYSYLLEGVDDIRSAWEYAAFKEYTVLSPGKYTFHVKARSLLGEKNLKSGIYLKFFRAGTRIPEPSALFVCL